MCRMCGDSSGTSAKDILEEAREFAAHGCLELTLGQIVNHYVAFDLHFSESYTSTILKLLGDQLIQD